MQNRVTPRVQRTFVIKRRGSRNELCQIFIEPIGKQRTPLPSLAEFEEGLQAARLLVAWLTKQTMTASYVMCSEKRVTIRGSVPGKQCEPKLQVCESISDAMLLIVSVRTFTGADALNEASTEVIRGTTSRRIRRGTTSPQIRQDR